MFHMKFIFYLTDILKLIASSIFSKLEQNISDILIQMKIWFSCGIYLEKRKYEIIVWVEKWNNGSSKLFLYHIYKSMYYQKTIIAPSYDIIKDSPKKNY